jgi:hypothetical protein
VHHELRAAVLIIVLVSLYALVGCQQQASAPKAPEKKNVEEAVEEIQVPANVPAHEITKDEEVALSGLTERSVSVSTDVTSEGDLGAITRKLWVDTDADTLQVTFFPNEPMAESVGSGMAFVSEEAARTTFRAISAQGASPEAIEEDVRQAMRNDGIYVIATEEMIDDIIEEECANWDRAAMGSPPPEWDCPGY